MAETQLAASVREQIVKIQNKNWRGFYPPPPPLSVGPAKPEVTILNPY